jgi:hypothetical protein
MKVRIKKVPQARTGYQVQGSLANDVPAMGGADYNTYIGKPNLKASKYMTAVPREEANLEAEGGETVYGDINGDGMAEHKIIKGPRHSGGGVPLNLPDDTFIYSDFRGMNIKEPEFLQMFGKGGKGKKSYTPAELAKQYDIEKYRKILQDPNSDKIDRKTAELMIKNYQTKLAALALVQEGKKGFPQGMPAVARPMTEENQYTEDTFVDPSIKQFTSQIDAKIAQAEEEQATSEQDPDFAQQAQQAQEMNQGQPVAQPQDMEQPMAQYGMSIGGYDVPFGELPDAEYGMSMGITSKNYMGRPKSPMYARGGALETYQEAGAAGAKESAPAASTGSGDTLDLSGMSPEESNKAYYMWKRKNPNKEPNLTREGKKVKYNPPSKKENIGISDLKALNDTEMKFLKKELNDPKSKIREEIINKSRSSLENRDITSPRILKEYKDKKGTISDQKIIDSFLNSKERNDKIKQSGIELQYFKNDASKLMTADEMVKAGVVKDVNEANKKIKEYTAKGWASKNEIAKNLGVKIHADRSLDGAIEQSTYHAIAQMQRDKKEGKYNDLDDNTTYNMDQFLGRGVQSRESHTGAKDNPYMAKAYGDEYASMSAIEGTSGNSFLGQSINPAVDTGSFEDMPEEQKQQAAETPCEACKRADGSSYVPAKNPDGTCAPCEEATATAAETSIPQETEPEMWLQDKIKTAGAFGDLMSAKKYMPWSAKYDLKTPKPTFMDPTRELAANAEQANIQTQALGQFAGPQALSARSSGVMGAASKNAADVLAKYNNANVNIANQFESNIANVENQEQQLNTAAQQKLYDQNTIANQQFDNTKRALRNNLMNQTTSSITNMMKTDAMNQLYPQYNVDAGRGGKLTYDESKARKIKAETSGNDFDSLDAECRKLYKEEKSILQCIKDKRSAGASAGNSDSGAEQVMAMYKQKGGFIYSDITFPFIL